MSQPAGSRLRRGVRYIGKLALFAIVTFVLIIEVVGAWKGVAEADALFHPHREVFCCDTPADAGYEYQSVTLKTEDGLYLYGWYVPGDNGAAILLAHGAHGNRVSLWDVAQMLHRHGYGVLVFDMRAHGTSDGDNVASGWLDIIAAADYLAAQGVKHIGAYGFSLGADMVIQGAAKTEQIEAVAADGASPAFLSDSPLPRTVFGWLYFSYDIAYWTHLESISAPYGGFGWTTMRDAAAKIAPRPLLLIAAGAELSRYEANVVQGIYAAAGEPKTLWVIDDVLHGGGYGKYPQEFERRVVGFYDDALLKVD